MIINAKGFVFFERIEFYWQLGLSLSSNLLYFYQNGKYILMGFQQILLPRKQISDVVAAVVKAKRILRFILRSFKVHLL